MSLSRNGVGKFPAEGVAVPNVGRLSRERERLERWWRRRILGLERVDSRVAELFLNLRAKVKVASPGL
jgi:hypothetical protein